MRTLKSLALVVAPVAVLLLAAPIASASSQYAIGKAVCHRPAKPLHARCFVMKRVIVTRGTPGAHQIIDAPASIPGVAPTVRTQGPAGGLTPADLAKAYSLTPTGGSGQILAMVDAYNDPNIQADLKTFDAEYGLPAPPSFKVVSQTGSTTSLPANDTSGWSIEESLDVESAHSVCEKCSLILVETNSNAFSDLEAGVNEAVALGANEISNSYGGPETGVSATDKAAYNHPGVVITASAGDQGWYDYEYDLEGEGPINVPNFPASSNDVVSVGGTSLFFTQAGARSYETVWNDDETKASIPFQTGDLFGATGGGCSTVFTAQTWQKSAANWAATTCKTKRLSNDVSAVADEFTGFDLYDSYDYSGSGAPGWATYGGTSLASPIIAAVFGLAGGAHGVAYPTQTLYSHPSDFNDVTVGGNGVCDGQGAPECGNWNNLGYGALDCDYNTAGTAVSTGDDQCDAAAGYDGPTGLGTPDGTAGFTP